MIIKIENNGSVDFIDLDKALGVNIQSGKLFIKFPNGEYEIEFHHHKEQFEIVEKYFIDLYEQFGPNKYKESVVKETYLGEEPF